MKLSNNQKNVLKYIKENTDVDAETISEMTGIKLYHVQLALNKLSDESLIEWVESPIQPMKGTHQTQHVAYGWRIKPTFLESWSKIISKL